MRSLQNIVFLLLLLLAGCRGSVVDPDGGKEEEQVDMWMGQKVNGNVHGVVISEGSPLQNVWVTDGCGWTKTDAQGHYVMKSDKKYGYVYIIQPSGHESVLDSAYPTFWATLSNSDKNIVERHDFFLKPVDDSKHSMVLSADWHLRGERDDLKQVLYYKNEVVKLASKATSPVYAMALGDITWDICWWDHNFELSAFRSFMADSPVPFYTVIGNHDYDYKKTSDFESSGLYRKTLGPTFYSMNIGSVHYVVLDNVTYISDGTGDVRDVEELLDGDQLAWLKEDLSHVSKSAPVVVGVHVPMHAWTWDGKKWVMSNRGTNYTKALDLLEGFQQVVIFSGHSHINEFFDCKAAGLSSTNMFERKVASLSGSLWLTGTIKPFNVAVDGTPAGYEILEVDGDKLSWRYKGVSEKADHIAHVYDMNSLASYWSSNAATKKLVSKYPEQTYKKHYGGLPANAVLVNVFSGDPLQKDMKLEVKENGKTLSLSQPFVLDPIHFVSTVAGWVAAGHGLVSGTYFPKQTSHLFQFVPSSPKAELELIFTDRNGNNYTQTLKLPKEFTDEE